MALYKNPRVNAGQRNKYLETWSKLKQGEVIPEAPKLSTGIQELITERGQHPLGKRRKIILDGLYLENKDGDDVNTATIVYNLE